MWHNVILECEARKTSQFSTFCLAGCFFFFFFFFHFCHLQIQLSFGVEELSQFVIENTHGSHTYYCVLLHYFPSLLFFKDVNKRHLA